MNFVTVMRLMPWINIIIAIVLLIKRKNINIKLIWSYFIYTFLYYIVLYITGIDIEIGFDVLLYFLLSIVTLILLIINIVLCSMKENVYKKYSKLNVKISMIIAVFPLLVYGVFLIRDVIVLNNSDMALIFDYRDNGGIGDGGTVKYAIKNNSCINYSINEDLILKNYDEQYTSYATYEVDYKLNVSGKYEFYHETFDKKDIEKILIDTYNRNKYGNYVNEGSVMSATVYKIDNLDYYIVMSRKYEKANYNDTGMTRAVFNAREKISFYKGTEFICNNIKDYGHANGELYYAKIYK